MDKYISLRLDRSMVEAKLRSDIDQKDQHTLTTRHKPQDSNAILPDQPDFRRTVRCGRMDRLEAPHRNR